jgi:hypothetical protein
MKLWLILCLIALDLLCIFAAGQSSENPFGSTNLDSTSLRGDIYYLPDGASSLPDFSAITPVGSIYTKVLDIPSRSFTSGFPELPIGLSGLPSDTQVPSILINQVIMPSGFFLMMVPGFSSMER